ncbi:uncharacterized protein EDB93DRAFT_1102922 [Suillus bovinus]|uniref:uncharacterized protein n=1 Tax=Suillus bovinus TaxID=48563 RepID=UPI001B885996|nr:uncharacterized protein EDB93DRAFT_1102922 [Suillus bovinus]KAG2152591.1 hypothetical protein EDB93DRAFT_1102922 [Suillus bovinus]
MTLDEMDIQGAEEQTQIFTWHTIDAVYASYAAAQHRVCQYTQLAKIYQLEADDWAVKIEKANHLMPDYKPVWGTVMFELAINKQLLLACSLNMLVQLAITYHYPYCVHILELLVVRQVGLTSYLVTVIRNSTLTSLHIVDLQSFKFPNNDCCNCALLLADFDGHSDDACTTSSMTALLKPGSPDATTSWEECLGQSTPS